MNVLDINAFPLAGQSLIEASAGTGKTYTITGLYNRLMMAHNSPFPRLSCEQILVVTFTRAATEELRGRIRQRLLHSYEDSVRFQQQVPLHDAALQAQFDELTDQKMPLSDWLQANLAAMDNAAIFTIHGFCQRMLTQFAFDSGLVFEAELVLDAEHYLQQACADVWRQTVYPLTHAQARWVHSQYADPNAVLRWLRAWVARPDVQVIPARPLKTVDELWQRAQQQYEQLQRLASTMSVEEITDLVLNSGVAGRSYTKKHVPNWASILLEYCQGEAIRPLPKNIERFTPSMMQSALKDGKTLPQHALFDALQSFLDSLQPLPMALQHHWLADVRTRYFALLEQAGVLTSDDLLRLLQRALQSSQGEALAQRIRQLYPVAMIDEFQDTDAIQYDIFSRIYPPADASRSANYGLYMIGDPKQAIYAFRGADIFTYIHARRILPAEQRFTLKTNWRSHSQLVKDVNRLFIDHPNPFLYQHDIDYVDVDAAGYADASALTVGGETIAPLQCWLDPEPMNKADAMPYVAQQTAERIQALLNGAGRLGGRDVNASDVAILVRNRQQAGWMRTALAEQGIGSVFLTHDSVFDSEQARDVLVLLMAASEPANERAVRTAIATRSHGFDVQTLQQLRDDERSWEVELANFHDYHRCWQQRGVMAMIMRWLGDRERAIQLRQQADGERCLTNMMHLGELLQTQSRRVRGMQALIRWLGERIYPAAGHDEQRKGEEAQLRLESDANLVTIVTIHKSKGLEYPIVFLPYLWADASDVRSGSASSYCADGHGTVLDLTPDEQAKAQQQREVLAENVRLLYVALTRAQYACFMPIAAAIDGRSKKAYLASTALGYVLNIAEQPNWSALLDGHASCSIASWPNWTPSSLARSDRALAVLPEAALSTWQAQWHWRVSSYSQLIASSDDVGISDTLLNSEYTEGGLDWDAMQPESPVVTAANSASTTVAESTSLMPVAVNFPKGAIPGTCLHAILEDWDFNDLAALATICAQQLAKHGLDAEWQCDLMAWLQCVVQTPLPCTFQGEPQTPLRLHQLTHAQRVDEMEFLLPITSLHAESINRLRADSRLRFEPLSGYLKGFIDLVFCHQGRYFIVDYKSNHLGDDASAYEPALLAQSMCEHQYDLQAWIYLVALDRLLAARLPNYQPEQHLGGVYYLYLRGMASEVVQGVEAVITASNGVYYQPVDVAALDRWRRLLVVDGEWLAQVSSEASL